MKCYTFLYTSVAGKTENKMMINIRNRNSSRLLSSRSTSLCWMFLTSDHRFILLRVLSEFVLQTLFLNSQAIYFDKFRRSLEKKIKADLV